MTKISFNPEALGRIGPAAREGGDPPLRGVGGVRGVPGLVRPVERAEAQVHDADGRHGRGLRERIPAEWSRRGGGGGGARHSLNTFRGWAPTSSSAMRSAVPSVRRPSTT